MDHRSASDSLGCNNIRRSCLRSGFVATSKASGELANGPRKRSETKIVADHGLETKWGGQLTWRAQYKVEYTVANKEYFVWSDSGIRGESEDEVHLGLSKLSPVCRVRYRGESPEAATAECR